MFEKKCHTSYIYLKYEKLYKTFYNYVFFKRFCNKFSKTTLEF